MKRFIRIISLLLTVMLLAGSIECLAIIDVFATESDLETTAAKGEEEVETIDYTELAYGNDADKLNSMEIMVEKPITAADGKVTYYYQLWTDSFSGEVATVKSKTSCKAEGVIKSEDIIDALFTNPYDVGVSTASTSIKEQLLSQVTVKYTDNDQEKYFYSYTDAASRDQIKVKNIKNGVRVEYTLGREEARMLVPRMIPKARYETLLRDKVKAEATEFEFNKFSAYYLEKDPDTLTSETAKAELKAAFPITETMAVYVFDPTASDSEKNKIEEFIKKYCPEYTYEEMDADHQATNYESEDENPPLFKLALEYTLGADGLTVRLPANGIRFNESLYQLTYVEVLPYMGAGNTNNEGFAFYPDGSGALFSFADPTLKSKISITGKVYGTDYAYQTISGTYQQTIRYPVFGIQEDTEYKVYKDANEDSETYEQELACITSVAAKYLSTAGSSDKSGLYEAYSQLIKSTTVEDKVKSRGYVAVIEEGDALASISVYTDASENDYATVRMQFTPRPKDSYILTDSIGVGSNEPWTVVCSRKYVGNYKIGYTMLTDKKVAEDNAVASYYPASWVGMALAYRDILEQDGTLTRLTDKDVKENIPLYIETFGTLETTEKILSIPVEVMTPLTTFDNIKSMYEELKENGINNINFKLTGYANGGMYSEVPYDLHWERAVGGAAGFRELLDYAESVNGKNGDNIGIYPDFDFSYIHQNDLFDAVALKQHASKTIDDRYANKRMYSATQQKYMTWHQLALSAAYMGNFYEHLIANYVGNYDNVKGISVASLGTTLNSDFDEDDPYNREDAKDFTVRAFEYFDKAGLNIMTSGGNAFTWKYADHILGLSLDSSRYIKASYSVPFIGVVLHGYVQYADDPLNMEGDIQYALMKAIENGSSIYFTLSYQNTQELKEDFQLSQYYSIRFDIWKEDVINCYTSLNSALKDVQTKVITNHEFISGTRVPDSDEIEADAAALIKDYYDTEYQIEFEQQKLAASQISIARTQLREAESSIANSVSVSSSASSNAEANIYTVEQNRASYFEALADLDKYIQLGYDKLDSESSDATEKTNANLYIVARNKAIQTRTRLIRAISQVGYYANTAKDNYDAMLKVSESAKEALEIIRTSDIPDPELKELIIAESQKHYDMTQFYLNNSYYAVSELYKDEYIDSLLAGSNIYDMAEEFGLIENYAYKYVAVSRLSEAENKLASAQKAMSDNQTALQTAVTKAIETLEKAEDGESQFAVAVLKQLETLVNPEIEIDPAYTSAVSAKDFSALDSMISELNATVAGLEAKTAELAENAKTAEGDDLNAIKDEQKAVKSQLDSANANLKFLNNVKILANDPTEEDAAAWVLYLQASAMLKSAKEADPDGKSDLYKQALAAESGVEKFVESYAALKLADLTLAATKEVAGEELCTRVIDVLTAYNNLAEAQAAFASAYSAYAKKKNDENLAAFNEAKTARNNALNAYAELAGGKVADKMANIIEITDKYEAMIAEYNEMTADYNAKKKAFNENPGDADVRAAYNAAEEAYENAKLTKTRVESKYTEITGAASYPDIIQDDMADTVALYPTLHYTFDAINLVYLQNAKSVDFQKAVDAKIGVEGEYADVTTYTAETFFKFIRSLEESMSFSKNAFEGSRDEVVAASQALDCAAEFKISKNDIDSKVGGTTKEEEKEEVEEFDKYLTDDGKIVAVTYGEMSDPYKTFIINYNNFAVKVEYNGIVYTINKYDYVTIYHQN